jgi:hypothetical protein
MACELGGLEKHKSAWFYCLQLNTFDLTAEFLKQLHPAGEQSTLSA